MLVGHVVAAQGSGWVFSYAQMAPSGRSRIRGGSISKQRGHIRRRWATELALQGVRLSFSRACLAFLAPSRLTDRTFEATPVGFDKADSVRLRS